MLTLAGFLLPALVGGSVIVETVFSIPGLGRLFVEAAFQRDLPVLLGLTLLSGAATLAGIVAADLAYVGSRPEDSPWLSDGGRLAACGWAGPPGRPAAHRAGGAAARHRPAAG